MYTYICMYMYLPQERMRVSAEAMCKPKSSETISIDGCSFKLIKVSLYCKSPTNASHFSASHSVQVIC